MKRMLLGAVICSTVTFSPVKALNQGDKELLSIVGGSIGFVSTCCIGYKMYSILPSTRYASAQKTYMKVQDALNHFVHFDQETGDIASYAGDIFPSSAYPLVTLFNWLDGYRVEAKNAIKELDNALWWSQEEFFVVKCSSLKKSLERFILTGETLNKLVRMNGAWFSQYELYLQQCRNEELRHQTARLNDISWQMQLNRWHNCCK